MRFDSRKLIVVSILSVILAACGPLQAILSYQPKVERLVPQVIAVYPHDPTAFTEGLIYLDGALYESTGRYEQSTLRKVDPESGAVEQSVALPAAVFGEGLAAVGDQLVQLTWNEGVGYRYDLDSLALETTFPYDAEGWGMCYDGDALYTSDGSADLTERDPGSLAAIRQVEVTENGQPITQINELECVGDAIYANVWHTDDILKIDKQSGRVTAVVDASDLLNSDQRANLEREAVLNGIAYVPERDTFLVTGKLWSWMFEVTFVPASD